MVQAGVSAPAKRPADRAFAETRGTDPDGNNFDLLVRGYDDRPVASEPAASKAPNAGVSQNVSHSRNARIEECK
jgi:hypothetical protein